MQNQARQIMSRVKAKFAPPEKITVSEWADQYRVLSPESSGEPGKWKTSRTPYLREIMDCANDRTIKEIVVMASSQVGKSEGPINNTIGYYVDMEPCPILLLEPTIQLAEDYSKDRIAPMIRDCKRLTEKVAPSRARDSSSTVLHKSFAGGHLTISGANSPASLATRPIRLLLIDEVDRMGTTPEGDPVALAEKRTTTFYNALVIKVSTPSIKDLSRIERAYKRSDQRKYYVPCPACGYFQVLSWHQVKWEKDDKGNHLPITAYYLCKSCGHKLTDGERYQAVAKGKWQTSEVFNGVAGFHLNELNSLWRKLSDIVQAFVDAQAAPDLLRVWVNTTLGEPYSIKTRELAWEVLYNRRESYDANKLPKGVIFLTAGCDVQEDRIHIEIVGWGRNFESWSIEYRVFYGDTTEQQVYKDLDSLIGRTWKTNYGYEIGITKLAIDAGFNTAFVHTWVRQYSLSTVFPVIGRDRQHSMVGMPERAEIANNKTLKRGIKSYPLGVSLIKQEIYGFLGQQPPEVGEGFPFGYCHFPQEYKQDYFQQLTAEKQVKTFNKGVARYSWVKVRDRNEALDCRVYARAAACLFGIDRFSEERWTQLEQDFSPPIKKRVASQIQRNNEVDEYWED